MSFARDQYTATASQTDFTITYPYQAEEDVVVTVDGVTKTQGGGSDYIFSNATTIQFNSGLTAGEIVVLRRSTSQSARDVDFTAGPLTEADLDNNAIQMFYMAQEAIDQANLSIRQGSDGQWAGQSLRITDVADPTAAQDAATKAYIDAIQLSTGNVPTPDNPGEDDYIIKASGGTFDWASPSAVRTALSLDPLAIVKSNLSATTDPAVGDDSGDGYGVGSLRLDVTNDRAWVCVDPSVGAAVWVEIGNPLTTAGDIVYRGANRMERLALGGAGEVLASLAGGAPVWTRGNWVKIGNTQTASTSAAIDFRDGVSGYVFDSTYDLYRIKAHDVHLAADGAHLAMQFYQAASLITSANYAWVSGIGSSSTDTPSGASSGGQAITTALIPIFNIGAAAGEQGVTEILIPGPSITKFPEAIWRGLSISDTGLTFGQTGGGHLGISAAADGVRLVPNSGNIDSGTFTLSGMKL